MSEPSQKTLVHESSDSLQMETCSLYLALTRAASVGGVEGPGREPSLGGKLLYAGELDAHGRAKVIAGNVAGGATLAATADAANQRQSIRDGVVDFLVTSLDESLRILKNEIRKRKTVAVCVGAAPATVEREMMERGVQPDLVFATPTDEPRILPSVREGALEVQIAVTSPRLALLTWQVAEAPARWMPKLDAAALGFMDADSWEARWLRRAPRYLGRPAFAMRSIFCDQQLATVIIQELGKLVRTGDIGTDVSARLVSGDESTVFQMRPGVHLQTSQGS